MSRVFGSRTVLVMSLALLALILGACKGEDRPLVDVIPASERTGVMATDSVNVAGLDIALGRPTTTDRERHLHDS